MYNPVMKPMCLPEDALRTGLNDLYTCTSAVHMLPLETVI